MIVCPGAQRDTAVFFSLNWILKTVRPIEIAERIKNDRVSLDCPIFRVLIESYK